MEISEVPVPVVTQGLCPGVGAQAIVDIGLTLTCDLSSVLQDRLAPSHTPPDGGCKCRGNVNSLLLSPIALSLLTEVCSCLVTEMETHLLCLFLCILSFFPAGMNII